VRTYKSNPLALYIVVALLAVIVVVLILPDVDLPDTAFQRSSSLQTLNALSHQMPPAREIAGSFLFSFQVGAASIPPRQLGKTHSSSRVDLSILHGTLRC
jgi:hypothetical protein